MFKAPVAKELPSKETCGTVCSEVGDPFQAFLQPSQPQSCCVHPHLTEIDDKGLIEDILQTVTSLR